MAGDGLATLGVDFRQPQINRSGQIRKQVDRARRRLWLELFLGRLTTCLFIALAAAAIAIAVPKLFIIENLPQQWAAWCLAGATGAGILTALAWTLVRGRSELDAAIEIDRRFDLKERVASSLSLPPEAAETPAGRALIADALRAVNRLEIDERFQVRLSRAAWLPLGPALIASLLILLFNDKQAQSSISPTPAITAKALDKAAEALRNKLKERREEAARRGLAEAEALLLEMERNVEKISESSAGDPKKALVRLNDLARQLEERRDKAGGASELQRQLNGMKDMAGGPADKMVDAMKAGDWKLAQDELKKLHEQLKSGKLGEADQKLAGR
jgi:hypothetical protein